MDKQLGFSVFFTRKLVHSRFKGEFVLCKKRVNDWLFITQLHFAESRFWVVEVLYGVSENEITNGRT